jgi:hypothetical protein
MLADPINWIEEGSHRRLLVKDTQSRDETHWIKPSTTINRGQKSSEIFQTSWEVCEFGFAIEFDLEFECDTFNDHNHDHNHSQVK